MSVPRIVHWQDDLGRDRTTLVRGEAGDADGRVKDVTVIFTQAEWWLLRRTVLAEFGLISERQSRENVDVAYQEAERAQARVAHLERELKYAATGEDADDETEHEDE